MNLGAQATAASSSSASATSQQTKKDLPIERFAGLIDTEDARFDKQRLESTKQSTAAVAHACHA